MFTPNIYELDKYIQKESPQQRQVSAQNWGQTAALLGQSHTNAENMTRTKLQTPPPPQGTVMNQYYQWPQQQPEMGLAQPGLEDIAQQYAAGGLVAFADGGPVYDYDGGDAYGAYAEGGLATMLPIQASAPTKRT